MLRPRSPLLKRLLALAMVLVVLCAATGPAFDTLQEVHELGHALPAADDEPSQDGAVPDGDTALEGLLHAQHCCAHAVVLPSALMLPSPLLPQEPPRFVDAVQRASPTSRLLRPPISA